MHSQRNYSNILYHESKLKLNCTTKMFLSDDFISKFYGYSWNEFISFSSCNFNMYSTLLWTERKFQRTHTNLDAIVLNCASFFINDNVFCVRYIKHTSGKKLELHRTELPFIWGNLDLCPNRTVIATHFSFATNSNNRKQERERKRKIMQCAIPIAIYFYVVCRTVNVAVKSWA